MSLPRFPNLLRAALLLAAAAAIAGCTGGRDAYAITDSGTMIKFQTDDPGSIDNEVTVTGLDSGESLLQIDFRPETGALYGLTSSNRIATVDADTGLATLVSATPFLTAPATLNQPVMDFNPAQDFIRVIDYQPGGSATATNILRINPETGALIQSDGTVLRYNDSDTNDGEIPQLAAIAHSNNDIDATTTTLYGLEFTTQSLVRVTNAGVLTTIGILDRQFVTTAGFDVVRERGRQPRRPRHSPTSRSPSATTRRASTRSRSPTATPPVPPPTPAARPSAAIARSARWRCRRTRRSARASLTDRSPESLQARCVRAFFVVCAAAGRYHPFIPFRPSCPCA